MSFAEFVKTLREREREKNREFERFIHGLTVSYPHITIILFGSRAENRSHYLSDYDLLILTENQVQCSEITSIPLKLAIDLHCYSIEAIQEEIKRFNTIVIDALHSGTCIHDGGRSIDNIRSMVEERIAESGLVRMKEGWIPNSD
ncbi:MAG: hypothetical protein GF411_18990 [Candidatus Lokiarchaeota archaeon]|nr:hypothetical protein [Candidatus Lokiarchaeota archaeon]